MIAGMVAMALAIGRDSDEVAPPVRAVIGELLFATVAKLLVSPTILSVVQPQASVKFLALDPNDPDFLASVPGCESRSLHRQLLSIPAVR